MQALDNALPHFLGNTHIQVVFICGWLPSVAGISERILAGLLHLTGAGDAVRRSLGTLHTAQHCTTHGTTLYCTLHNIVLHTAKHCTAHYTTLYCTLHNIVLHTTQHCTAHCTTLYCTLQNVVLHTVMNDALAPALHCTSQCGVTCVSGRPSQKSELVWLKIEHCFLLFSSWTRIFGAISFENYKPSYLLSGNRVFDLIAKLRARPKYQQSHDIHSDTKFAYKLPLNQSVSDHLKVSPKAFIFFNHQFALINYNLFMKTDRFTFFMTKSLRDFFWRNI